MSYVNMRGNGRFPHPPRFVGNTAVCHSIIQLYCAAVHIKLLPHLNQQSISSGTFVGETAVSPH
ncbi:MAG: hypothetical protein GY943_39485 [Chloroflexi bacterium]|nr:hypothetical protein [Chloroflexota bacterium]